MTGTLVKQLEKGSVIILGLWMISCSSPVKPEAKASSHRLPPNEMGVRTTRSGEAVVEVEEAAQMLFETAEDYLRVRYKVTFINRSLLQIEAQTKSQLFVIRITSLTTGKMGLSVAVTDRDGSRPEPGIAREVANDILSDLRERATSKSR